MWLIRLALRRPISVMVAAAAILLGAWLSIRSAPADIFPSLGIPVIYVVQPYAGMSPSQIESQFVTYYEYHFLYIAGLDHIESQSIQGAGLLKLYFRHGTDIAQSMAQVTAMTFRANSFMPPGTLPAFIVRFDAVVRFQPGNWSSPAIRIANRKFRLRRSIACGRCSVRCQATPRRRRSAVRSAQ